MARHREFPELPLDNCTSERALRGPVVGRKNYYGSGSVVSAELASRVWTITATAQRFGLNPLAYLDSLRPSQRHRPGGPGADPVPALGSHHRRPHRLGPRPPTQSRHRARHHRQRRQFPGRSAHRADTMNAPPDRGGAPPRTGPIGPPFDLGLILNQNLSFTGFRAP